MLVLTRKSNQSIMIGDDIEVSVCRSWARRSGSASRRRGTSRCSARRSTSRSSRSAPRAGRLRVRAEVDEALRKLGEP